MDRETYMKMMEQKGFAFVTKTSGRSMRPLLWGKDHGVVVTPCDGDPKPGDLILFIQHRNGRETGIVHRLIGIRENDGERLYIARGDNCLNTETVRREEIIGSVAEVHRITGFKPWHIIPKREFTTADAIYRLYSRIWTAIWPLRRFCYRVRGKFFRAKRVES